VIAGSAQRQRYDVVGPGMRERRFSRLDRDLALSEGDLLAIMNAGAYSAAMSSNYNSRPRRRVLVDESKCIYRRTRGRRRSVRA